MTTTTTPLNVLEQAFYDYAVQQQDVKTHYALQIIRSVQSVATVVGKEAQAIVTADILRWKTGWAGKKSTLRTRISHLRTFYAWLTMGGGQTPIPANLKVKVNRDDPYTPSAAEYQAMLPIVADSLPALRYLFHLLAGSGMRLNEALQMPRDAIDFDEEILTLSTETMQIKRDHGRHTICSPEGWAFLRSEAAQRVLMPLPLSERQVRYFCEKLTEAAGLRDRLTPHALRRYAANHWYWDLGMPAERVADLLGHASVDTTRTNYLERRTHKSATLAAEAARGGTDNG